MGEERKEELSLSPAMGRRGFLKLASVAGLAAGATALTGCAGADAAGGATDEAEINTNDNSTPIDPVEAPSSWTE